MRLDFWQQLGIVCGSLLTACTLVALVWTKAIRPMWRYTRRTVRRLNEMADQLLGDQGKGIPSVTERMTKVEHALNRHITWHAGKGAGPAKERDGEPNGQPGRRDPRQR